ncbi:GAD-like domain-containing protein [Agrococcus carbonis]|uniref:GAD-related domain-containing protein n=1 Tax=Agrococcus carbonis TaxID=684552 RepID=A0A1H1PIL7_9MICO|nr:GAD-like domain-containing protein [Agrococcus carbonis]SDS10920.1 hypothetical protein SAMN04489719_1562 [Agrococcus carbonis]
MLEIPDFAPHAPVDAATAAAYEGLVPEEVLELWERYGYGSFGDGFVRVVDPHAYEARIGNLLGKMIGDGRAVPIMVTALADVVLWEPDRGVTGLLLRQRRAVGLGSRPRTLLQLTAKHGRAHLARAFDWAPYPEAVARLGAPAYDEVLAHLPERADEPAPALEALARRAALPTVEALLDRQGPILH